ncbi:MAG: HAD family hydrolase [Phycisphaerae bacterium]
MSALQEQLRGIDTLTFDCYGTLIDWRRGWRETFGEIFGRQLDGRMDELVGAYESVEAEVEQAAVSGGGFMAYRDVLTEVTRRLAGRLGLQLQADRADLLARRLPDWRPFDDTGEALSRLKKRFRLGAVSNVDRDLFAGTTETIRRAMPAGGQESAGDHGPFDFVITAEDVGSYKPAQGHFERLLSTHADRTRVLHVAQSLFHDGTPAGALGIAFVWINRYNDVALKSAITLAELPDLRSLAEEAGV